MSDVIPLPASSPSPSSSSTALMHSSTASRLSDDGNESIRLLGLGAEIVTKLNLNQFVPINACLRQPREQAGVTEAPTASFSIDSTGSLKAQPASQKRRVSDFRTWMEAYANILAGETVFARSLPRDEADVFMEREHSFLQKATLQFGNFSRRIRL